MTSTRGSTTCPGVRWPGNWHAPTPAFLDRLPRDPRALLRCLRADGPEGRTASQPFTRAVGALRSGLVPADLRAALYAALTALPAVDVDEHATDCDGNPRVALVHDDGPTRTELIIDPVNGGFAGERDTLRTASRLGLARGHRRAVHVGDHSRGRHPRRPAALNGRRAHLRHRPPAPIPTPIRA